LRFQIHPKINHYISGLLNKPIAPRKCVFPLANPHVALIVDYVPDENIVNDLEGLCIRRSNLKYLDWEIMDANMKKFGYPNLLPG
jgi:hypothetical protein